jgi:hypothetical protein
MFDIHCQACQRRYLVGSRSIRSFHNTSEGPVAYVQCPHGHQLLRRFRNDLVGPAVAPATPAAA